MVCVRCKMALEAELDKRALQYSIIKYGELEIRTPLSDEMKESLTQSLLARGLELMEDNRETLIEKIKTLIVEVVHHTEEPLPIKFSLYLSEKLNYNYNYLSNLFSETKGITIEHFIISHKIERVKALLVYNELNLTEIARKLMYKNVAHLSNQFKKVTGISPSSFKKLKGNKLQMLENL